MTSPSSKRDDQPHRLQREFAHHWNGYDRAEVHEYLEQLGREMQRLKTDRDQAIAQANAMSQQLDAARAENGTLQARVEELMEPPKNLDDLDKRMQRVGHLAYLKADEITARAQAAAEENWKATAKASIALRERYRSLLKELDTHAEALHAEHRAALEDTRSEVQELTVEAVRRRDRLDAEAERQRRSIEQEFDANMASQRSALEKYIADQQTASKNQAERRIAEAAAEAKRRIAEATEEAQRRKREAEEVIDRLAGISEDAHGKVRSTDDLLARAESALEPLEEELLPVPRAEDAEQPSDAAPQAKADATPKTKAPDTTQNGSGNEQQQQAEKPSPRPHADAAAAHGDNR
ncbi:MAG: cell division protein DivIVA [Actinophytocola sp.]|nr:cell division protein DivIVA [Actinophytocola sp.]